MSISATIRVVEIDDDFRDSTMQSAPYTSDGTMLTARIRSQIHGEGSVYHFLAHRYMAGGGDRYFVYDRKLNGTAMEDLRSAAWFLCGRRSGRSRIFFGLDFLVLVLLLAGIAGTYVRQTVSDAGQKNRADSV